MGRGSQMALTLITFMCILCGAFAVKPVGRPGKNTASARASAAPAGILSVSPVGSTTDTEFLKAQAAFIAWLTDTGIAAPLPDLLRSSLFLDRLVETFGATVFDLGTPLGVIRHLVTGLERTHPYIRGALPRSWLLIRRWEQVFPTAHRKPIPRSLVLAIACIAFMRGHIEFALIVLMNFFFLLRPCEGINAVRSSLVLPSDTCSDTLVAYLNIPMPKSRWKGPKTQHASTDDPTLIMLLERKFGKTKRHERLYAGNATTFRRTWDSILKSLGVPHLMFSPASLRGGGACHCFAQNGSITNVMWKMRLSSQATLRFYLQEVVATSSLSELPDSTRKLITTGAKAFEAMAAAAIPPSYD